MLGDFSDPRLASTYTTPFPLGFQDVVFFRFRWVLLSKGGMQAYACRRGVACGAETCDNKVERHPRYLRAPEKHAVLAAIRNSSET